ncbi:CocE/NonD family hydrolase [Thalassococcus sp. S3]|uniref:CocE/NonD family hydrolase n=1 Tax=Thalassococcus sp. S3 TaxID=2017482 RepID=UPI00102454EA|nr:CocE/NonD family hydrolase [Thalassococcus sp. S3]QBF31108.1 peptidase S15 [Thalassococcus sp. S3]
MSKMKLREIEEEPDLGIVLSDGCRLSARVWRPVDAAEDPVPAILEYLPYRKRDGTCARDALTHPWFAKRGYASIRVDIRGNGDSQGLMSDEYTEQELSDAVEVIAWLAAQPWCSGKVGMMGISWGGFNALQVAARRPDALKAIITLCSTVDRFADDIHYKGGCLLNENFGWGSTMWSYSSRAPDPALRDDWRDMWLERLEHEPFLPSVWLRHQQRDTYWQHGSVCDDFGAIDAATLAVGGWGDAYKNAVPALVTELSAPVKGIVGPWVHKYPHFAVPEPRIGFLDEALVWWDKWLKDVPNGAETLPDYRAYVMDGVRPATWYTERAGHWVTSDPAQIRSPRQKRLFLVDKDLRETPGPLSAQINSPQHCGLAGGEYCAIWLGPEMPGDQRADDALSLCFDGALLEDDLSLLGAPEVRLALSADQPHAQIAVRLCHIHPDGASTRITYGVLNLSHREGAADPRPLVPGETYDVTLKLDHIGYRVPAGHRLRVAISSTYWPLVWPSPTPTTLTLSRAEIALPYVDNASEDACAFPPPDGEAPWRTSELRPPSNSRVVEHDLSSGKIRLCIDDDFGKVEDCEHGLISGSVARERWTIHPDDPLSAHGQTHWTDELERGGIRLRTETYAEMSSDITHFHLVARIEAYENDVLIYERDVRDSIARM